MANIGEHYAASVSHDEETIEELRASRAFAVEYLKAALAELSDPQYRAAGLLALGDIVKAYGGFGVAANEIKGQRSNI